MPFTVSLAVRHHASTPWWEWTDGAGLIDVVGAYAAALNPGAASFAPDPNQSGSVAHLSISSIHNHNLVERADLVGYTSECVSS